MNATGVFVPSKWYCITYVIPFCWVLGAACRSMEGCFSGELPFGDLFAGLGELDYLCVYPSGEQIPDHVIYDTSLRIVRVIIEIEL